MNNFINKFNLINIVNNYYRMYLIKKTNHILINTKLDYSKHKLKKVMLICLNNLIIK